MINNLLLSLLPSHLHHLRLHILQPQLQQFWLECSLLQMQRILTISNNPIIEYVWQYYSYYVANSKGRSAGDAYCVSDQTGRVIMWGYDCRLFRSSIYDREVNDAMGVLMLAYRGDEQVGEIGELYEFLDADLCRQARMLLKCKASCLLKFYPLFHILGIERLAGDTAVLPPELYPQFLYSWMHYSPSADLPHMVRHLFRGLLVLMKNQIALAFVESLSERDRYVRRYGRPVALYDKPKIKESCTMVEEGLGDVQWHTLRISGWRVKYKVVETENGYQCYRVEQDENEGCKAGDGQAADEPGQDEGNEEDRKILEAFQLARNEWTG